MEVLIQGAQEATRWQQFPAPGGELPGLQRTPPSATMCMAREAAAVSAASLLGTVYGMRATGGHVFPRVRRLKGQAGPQGRRS